jgi:hypothetical protein
MAPTIIEPSSDPTASPTDSFAPSTPPTESMAPSENPTVSSEPSDLPTTSLEPSDLPSESLGPTEAGLSTIGKKYAALMEANLFSFVHCALRVTFSLLYSDSCMPFWVFVFLVMPFKYSRNYL